MEDFGLPTWGSYLIFSVATIVLGAILGLVSLRNPRNKNENENYVL